MKKIMLIVLGLLLIIGLAACGGKASEKDLNDNTGVGNANSKNKKYAGIYADAKPEEKNEVINSSPLYQSYHVIWLKEDGTFLYGGFQDFLYELDKFPKEDGKMRFYGINDYSTFKSIFYKYSEYGSVWLEKPTGTWSIIDDNTIQLYYVGKIRIRLKNYDKENELTMKINDGWWYYQKESEMLNEANKIYEEHEGRS